MREISLTQEEVALVDDEDYEGLLQFAWRAQQNQDGRWYAMAWDGYPDFILMHRLIMQPEEGQWVDHKDGDGLNNQKSNLRNCTPSQNQAGKIPHGSTSDYKGVHYDFPRGKWKAVIKKDYISRFIGRFDSEIEAVKAYDVMALQLFGEFAYLNFPIFGAE